MNKSPIAISELSLAFQNLLALFGSDTFSQVLGIPSRRNTYQLKNGSIIPQLSGQNSNFEEDLNYWASPYYGTRLTPRSGDAEIDLVNILNSSRIIPTSSDLQQYQKILQDSPNSTLRYLAGGKSVLGKKVSIAGDFKLFFEQLAAYPVLPKSDLLQILEYLNPEVLDFNEIQKYLNSLGVTSFFAHQLTNLSFNDQFFWLTRYYGPPVDPKSHFLPLYFTQQAQNPSTLKIAKTLTRTESINLAENPTYLKAVLAFFQEFQKSPDSNAWKNLGAYSSTYFWDQPWTYFQFLNRSKDFQPLTLSLIQEKLSRKPMSFGGVSWSIFLPFLSKYADLELAEFFGLPKNNLNDRGAYLEDLAKYLDQQPAFLLYPKEASTCLNPTSVSGDTFSSLTTFYFGISLAGVGFRCYELTDLYQSFQYNRDEFGNYLFRDPQDYKRTFSPFELRKLVNALQRGRANLPDLSEYIRIFEEFAQTSELQASANYQDIVRLRELITNPEIYLLLKRLFENMFEMGMYARQWEGPGHPYPILRTETGTELEVGTQAEITLSKIITEKVQERNLLIQKLNSISSEAVTLFWKLPLYELTNQGIKQQDHRIQERCQLVESNKYCIRMNSNVFVYSGAYYLKQIFKEIIPNFDINQLIEFIS